MSLELERVNVVSHFQSVWEANDGPVAWPNQSFPTPHNSMFAVFNILDGATFRRSIGRSFFKRRLAIMQVDIYTPQNQGIKKSREIVDRLTGIYESLELPLPDGEMIFFGTPSSRVLDPNVLRAVNLDDNWDRYVFDAPYHRDEHVEK